jgi:hypothetical protein
MVVEVAKHFFLEIPDLERVCMGCEGRGTAGFAGGGAGFSGGGAGGTMEIFGEDKLVEEIGFK